MISKNIPHNSLLIIHSFWPKLNNKDKILRKRNIIFRTQNDKYFVFLLFFCRKNSLHFSNLFLIIIKFLIPILFHSPSIGHYPPMPQLPKNYATFQMLIFSLPFCRKLVHHNFAYKWTILFFSFCFSFKVIQLFSLSYPPVRIAKIYIQF